MGYRIQTCIDFSNIAIEHMRDKYKDYQAFTWLVMDVKAMDFADKTIDFAIDKVCTFIAC